MAICGICGDEEARMRGRWWDEDDGWRWAPLCDSCWRAYGARRPQKEDYAWEKRHEYDVDQALSDTDEDLCCEDLD